MPLHKGLQHLLLTTAGLAVGASLRAYPIYQQYPHYNLKLEKPFEDVPLVCVERNPTNHYKKRVNDKLDQRIYFPEDLYYSEGSGDATNYMIKKFRFKPGCGVSIFSSHNLDFISI